MSYEQLWAPWRLSYIKGEGPPQPSRPEGCFLCHYRDAEESRDAENLVVLRGSHCFIVLNRFPYNNGHLLVAPLAHKAGLSDLDEAEMLGCMRQLQQMTTLLTRVLNAEGFNIGLNLGRVAGAGLPGHLHWHIVPRWNGDSNYMTVIAETNVIPQSLEALYGILRDELARE